MNNLYILTNLLPKYYLGLDTIYHLSFICRRTCAYLQLLRTIQYHKKSNSQYYQQKIMCQLIKNNKFITIKTCISYLYGTYHESTYRRGKYRIEYTNVKNDIAVLRSIINDDEIPYENQWVNMFEYNNYIAIETEINENNTILRNMAHSNDMHGDNDIDTCKSCILYRVLQYRFHI